MELKKAVEADLEQVVELINVSFRGSEGWAVEEKYIEGPRITLPMLLADLAAKPEALLLTYRDEPAGPLLGCVWLEPKAPKEPGVWYLGLLSVQPALQERQLGRRMLATSEDVARKNGAQRMRIAVLNIREPLIAWYERRGYAKTGRTQPFPYGDDSVGRPLRDDLVFIVQEKEL